MAVLNKKEQKLASVLANIPNQYTDEQFVTQFIKQYPKDWGKIKSVYVKQSQDKELDTVINMPKPELYLIQMLALYLQREDKRK